MKKAINLFESWNAKKLFFFIYEEVETILNYSLLFSGNLLRESSLSADNIDANILVFIQKNKNN